MNENKPNVLKMALEKYTKEAREAKEKGNDESYMNAKWKIKYFKMKIKKKEIKEDE